MTDDKTPSARNSDSTIQVLLVDDQAIIAEGIRRMLESEKDIKLHYCSDPGKAINTAIEVNATVILQDLVMPDVDGMTLVRFYKANHATKDIPVIVLSSKEDPVIKRDAFGYGASDYLVKLPDQIELIARIRAHAKNYILQTERDAAFFALREIKKQLEASNRKLQKLSMLDGLTGIANRRHFDETINDELEKAASRQSALSLILIDIDYFKRFNDSYGHQGGDDCLIRVAKTLSSGCKNAEDLAARYGGEEFVILLPDTNEDQAHAVAERMRKAVQDLGIEHKASDVTSCVTLSMGIAALLPGEKLTAQQLIERTDKALYKAKEKGRNQSVKASSL
ncbi:MAG: Diguanylate cyclase response regulator [Pseudomonadota bacterium]|nr:Diguanylate cyclase response regulator [Pseudomonadota bacterium]